RRELDQVIAPVEPGVAARRLLEDGREAVLLEQLHRRPRRRDQAVILARREPEDLDALLQRRVVERRRVAFFEGGAERRGWCGRRPSRRRWRGPAPTAEKARTEHA